MATKGIEVFDAWRLPFLNTLILLLSGCTLTYAHHAIINDDRSGFNNGLLGTIILGLIFTALQVVEYMHAPFAFKESIYGATFFLATGFHGFHVVVGTIFLIVCYGRSLKGHFTDKQHLVSKPRLGTGILLMLYGCSFCCNLHLGQCWRRCSRLMS